MKLLALSPLALVLLLAACGIVVVRASSDSPSKLRVTLPGREYLRIENRAPGAHGNVPPIDTISGSNTKLSTPVGMAMDSQGRLFVANIGSASVGAFSSGASGNAKPAVTISGANTELSRPFSLGFDSKGRLLVADESAGVLVFAKNAKGNATPVAHITSVLSAAGVAADSKDRIWVAEFGEPPSTSSHATLTAMRRRCVKLAARTQR